MTNVANPDSFDVANNHVEHLLGELKAGNVCGCCAGRALMYHGISLFAATQGSAEAIEALEEIVEHLRKNPIFAPASGMQH